jgi:hypothetical protein
MATRFYFNIENFGQVGAALEDPGPAGESVRRELGSRLTEAMAPEFRTIGSQLGYRYEDSPIIVPDGTAPPPDESHAYEPSARPGSRAPHVWLADGRSTIDLFGRGFALLRFPGAPDASSIAKAAAARRVPLEVIDLGEPAVAELYQRRMVLVRPDGHVAWRSDTLPADSGALLDRVRGA